MDHDVGQQIRIERQSVEVMHARLDSEIAAALKARDRALGPVEGPQELYHRDVEVARLTRAVGDLRAADRGLCFGRIDSARGRSAYIGRIGLRSDTGAVLLLDWRADAARPFYTATPVSPLGLRRRRHLRLNGRRVVGVSDEILDGSSPTTDDAVGDAPLMAVLGRARTGRMQEAVATLQAEQDAIVRSPQRGVIVVDGGPGTGKTIVALHRAAYVLYTFPGATERGVLVFGPNRRFLDYIGDVLPSLGENDVQLATPGSLTGIEPTVTEPEAVARVKGRALFAVALDRWVRRHQPQGVPIEIRIAQERLVLDEAAVDAARRHALHDGLAHNPAREVFKEQIVGDLVDLMEKRLRAELTEMDDEITASSGVDLDELVAEELRALGLDDTITSGGTADIDWDGIRNELLEDVGLDIAIEAVWPRLDAENALEQFLDNSAELGALLRGLSDVEVVFLSRPREAGYSGADLALLDEARVLIDGPPQRLYGHIVADEAQELSEMQWRMLMRRCPARSFTIVGDFAQAGSATTINSWAEAVGPFVGDRFSHHTLTVNYRTTSEILQAATPLLARIAPDQQPSCSLRHGEHPRTITVTGQEIGTVLRGMVEQTSYFYPDELIGVIGPCDRTAQLATALGGTGAIIVAAVDARGLEFDNVFIVDPDAIQADRGGGIRDLYVALTRATKRAWTLYVTA